MQHALVCNTYIYKYIYIVMPSENSTEEETRFTVGEKCPYAIWNDQVIMTM